MFWRKKKAIYTPHKRIEKQHLKKVGEFLILGHHIWPIEMLSNMWNISILFATDKDCEDIKEYYDQNFYWTVEGYGKGGDSFIICDFATIGEAQTAIEFITEQLSLYQKTKKDDTPVSD